MIAACLSKHAVFCTGMGGRAGMELSEFLMNPAVMMIILTIGLVGLLVELFSPGVGLGALIGLASFAVFFGTYIHAGTAGASEPLLFIAGIILILLEIFLPTLGIVGMIGLILVAVSIFNAVPIFSEAIWIVAGAVLLTAVIVWILIRFLGWEVKWNRVVLRSSQSNEEGYTSSKDRNELLGQVGITLTPLRPSGFAKFGDRKEDVVSEGEIIPSGEEVKVIHVEGMRVVVKRVKDLDSDH